MLREVFSPKPYDFTTLFTSWPDAPIFTGHLKKDGPVSDWLQKIKTGCKLRKVPKVIRHDVAEHYLNGKAKKRFESLKVVMRNLHGGKYKWDWKKFEIAMVHMCWEMACKETQGFKIAGLANGLWWILGKASQTETTEEKPKLPESPSRKANVLTTPVRKIVSHFEKGSSRGEGPSTSPTSQVVKPGDQKKTLTSWWPRNDQPNTAIQHAPVWLLNVTHTLDALTHLRTTYPKTMTVVSAVLVTVGSIPHLSAVSAGAAGAVLASDAAKFVGSLAIDLGGWLQNDVVVCEDKKKKTK
ncbi:hypothetical protein NLI96_g4513 [Meripilus lineatus]|uniref:Uncharacterized protein n=1 Tax=Meripilus lineatus TaxID=2056292 RepID=A0AAD5VA19_9APHY|nr:hypothetical protein NLI96_g4513 [Physisporinus lineatus]